MAISYKKLWKLLIDKDMKKKDLEQAAGISHYTIGKLNRGDNVTTEVLAKICIALGCTMDDIMEIIPDHTDRIRRNNNGTDSETEKRNIYGRSALEKCGQAAWLGRACGV